MWKVRVKADRILTFVDGKKVYVNIYWPMLFTENLGSKIQTLLINALLRNKDEFYVRS